MLRAILSVMAGYFAMAVVLMVLLIPLLLAFGLPLNPEAVKTAPPTAYVICNLLVSFLAACLGGFVAARIGGHRPAWMLSVLMVLLGIVYAIRNTSPFAPEWYVATLPVVCGLGIVTGARPWRRGQKL